MDIKKTLKALQKVGFKIEHSSGSRMKVIPQNKALPFYSLHLNNTGKAFFPLKRFARAHWSIDLEKL